MVDFAGSHVVVTGGTGSLGRAVVAALRGAGAVCHIPNLVRAELADFPFASDADVRIAPDVDVTDESAVRGSTRRCRRCGRRSTSPAGLRWPRSATPPPPISLPSSG